MQTKTVEAFEHRWVFGENTKWADLTRQDLMNNAKNHIFKHYKRPSEQRGVWVRFLPYWPDIMSSAVEVYKKETVEPKEGEEVTEPKYTLDNNYLLDLMNNATKWEALMLSVEENGLEEDLFALHNAAKECNPHWQKAGVEPDPPEVAEAAEVVGAAYTFLANTDESDALPPDTDKVVEAVATVVEHRESVARKKG